MTLFHTAATHTEAMQTMQRLNLQGYPAGIIQAGGYWQVYILNAPKVNVHKPTKKAKNKPQKAQFEWRFYHTVILITLLSSLSPHFQKAIFEISI